MMTSVTAVTAVRVQGGYPDVCQQNIRKAPSGQMNGLTDWLADGLTDGWTDVFDI